jgi:DNA polymerase-1
MSIKTKEKLVLLDAYAILHRAFHALPNFTSSRTGEPTGALYGFTAFLLKTIRELRPDYLVACYDLAEPTFRHIAYEQYKAQRPKPEDILIKQIDRSRDILKVLNIPIYDSPGFEADDILGTIVEQVKFKIKIIIASGDLDTLQLVKDDDVVVYTLSKGIKETVIYDEEKVYERFGFGPELITDFKALKGDPSDNIIGVRGIGDKTAIELIKNFGSIENLYKILKSNPGKFKETQIKERVIKLLEENEEEAMFSKTLAEIRKDAPIKFSLEQSKWRDSFDVEKVKPLFNELGFKSLIDRLPS